MEKLLGFYDTLNKLNTNSQFNVLLIIPVITVFFLVQFLFLFAVFARQKNQNLKKYQME